MPSARVGLAPLPATASTGDEILLEGYVQKKKQGKHWMHRYVVLKQRRLYYFKSEEVSPVQCTCTNCLLTA